MTEIEAVVGKDDLQAETPAPDVSVVVTLFNEVACVEELYRRTLAALDAGHAPSS